MAKLVAIGDSLTQGFQSLAVTNVDTSFPAMIAEAMGLDVTSFRVPNFRGSGGLPCNLEWLARRIAAECGDDITGLEWLQATYTALDLLDEVEDYWERGKGVQPSADALYHNLAVWGFEVADAYDITAGYAEKQFRAAKDEWFSAPSFPRHRTAHRVLNPAQLPARSADTQLSIAQRIAKEQGGIDHLILWLGANNCLSTVVRLCIKETGPLPPGPDSGFTLWTAGAFAAEYAKLAQDVAALKAKHVYVATVPHVTIPPITRGVMANCGRLPRGRRYFDYYTHFFIKDKEFDPRRDPHLTGDEAKYIDARIDEYNGTIRAAAQAHGWHVVDTCGLLDDLAVRRNHGTPKRRLPAPIADLSIRLFEVGEDGKVAHGGLISLDGVHPTTCGYAIVAQEFIQAMRKADPQLSVRDIDFGLWRRRDGLVSQPPRVLRDVFSFVRWLEEKFHVTRWMSRC